VSAHTSPLFPLSVLGASAAKSPSLLSLSLQNVIELFAVILADIFARSLGGLAPPAFAQLSIPRRTGAWPHRGFVLGQATNDVMPEKPDQERQQPDGQRRDDKNQQGSEPAMLFSFSA